MLRPLHPGCDVICSFFLLEGHLAKFNAMIQLHHLGLLTCLTQTGNSQSVLLLESKVVFGTAISL